MRKLHEGGCFDREIHYAPHTGLGQIGEFGQNLDNLKAHFFKNMKQNSSKVALMDFL